MINCCHSTRQKFRIKIVIETIPWDLKLKYKVKHQVKFENETKFYHNVLQLK